jgi:histidinol-phosphate aminotransferase
MSLVGPHILRLKPYVPGKPIEEVQREFGLTDVVKLASNENPLGPSPRAVAAIREHAAKVAFYPEGAAPALRKALSEFLAVPPDTLVFGNGSDEILHLLCAVFIRPGKDETIQGDPSFSMYEIYATLADAKVNRVPLKNLVHDLPAMADRITPNTRLIFIANPNNPTGTIVSQTEIDRFMDRVPNDVIVVFDEAYHEYVDPRLCPNVLPYIEAGRNVVVTRTFSKAYGIAGLRVGYAIARPEIVAHLERARSPFNVNILAQAAATAAIADQDHINASIAVNVAGKAQLTRAFDSLGLEYTPSQANFVLVDIKGDSREMFQALLRHGVIIRPGSGLGLPNYIRVSIGTEQQNSKFIDALNAVLRDRES